LTAGPDTCLPRMFGAALAGSIEEEKLRPMSAGGHVVKAVQGTTRTCVCLGAPHLECTCGIYAGGNLEYLRKPGYERSLINGRVLLWGTVVEHRRGWRAQYACPHSFLLPPEVLPVTVKEIAI
jgi:hypothetical protein